jgi:hypothetical protein
MGQSAEELTAQIAQTRGSLSNDLDELQDKVSPSAIVDRQKAAARERVSGVRDKVMGHAQDASDSMGSATSGAAATAQDHYLGAPLAAGLAAFGLGMVVAALIPASKVETRAAVQVVDTAKTQAQPLVEEAKSAAADIGAHLKDQAVDAVGSVKDTATEAASTVQEEGSTSVDEVRSQVSD